jgi:hypothetical protein
MAKGDNKKVKTTTSSCPKYVSSDEDTLSSNEDNASSDDDESLPSEFYKYPNAMIKGLMKQELGMSFLSKKRNCLFKKERAMKNSRSS